MTTMTEIGRPADGVLSCGTCGSAFRHDRKMVAWGSSGVMIYCDDKWHEVEQLEFDIAPLVKPPHVEGQTIQERFMAFHLLNPSVYTALERLVKQWIEAGNSKVGMKMMFEVLRWRHGVVTQGDVWKLNNSHTSRYARLLIDSHPEWAACIETRELKAA